MENFSSPKPSPKTPPTYKLQLHWAGKEVDKAKKQRFTVKLPSFIFSNNMELQALFDPHQVCPDSLKQNIKSLPTREISAGSFAPERPSAMMSMEVFSSLGENITFGKCHRCHKQDSDSFTNDNNTPSGLNSAQEPRNSYGLSTQSHVNFKKGKAELSVLFRCCPSHIANRGENFIFLRVILDLGLHGSIVSEFVKIQWKKARSKESSCTCSSSVEELQQQNAKLKNQLDAAMRELQLIRDQLSQSQLLNSYYEAAASQSGPPSTPLSSLPSTPENDLQWDDMNEMDVNYVDEITVV